MSKVKGAGLLALGGYLVWRGARELMELAGEDQALLPESAPTQFASDGLTEDAAGLAVNDDEVISFSDDAQSQGVQDAKVVRVRNINERVKLLIDIAKDGSIDPFIVNASRDILSRREGGAWELGEKKWGREIAALWWALKDPSSPYAVRYTRDHALMDQFQSPKKTIELHSGDCFPAGTRLLAEGHRLIPIEYLTKGTKIWGLNDWSKVEAVGAKGVLPFTLIQLNNGNTLRLTEDHHVYVTRCARHSKRSLGDTACHQHHPHEIEETTIRVSELLPGDVMTQPERVAFGEESLEPDHAYLEGLYISDGWKHGESSFDIAGQDGCPKEFQKRRVAAICQRLGIPWTWNFKEIRVRDRDWTQHMKQFGTRAPVKQLLSLNWDEQTAAQLLRGIMADSGKNSNGDGRTFTTTSAELCLQVRLLWRMFGRSCGFRYIEDHGGLGKNPIYRLQIRQKGKVGARTKRLCVKSIDREVIRLPAYDIQTSDHRVYLPEYDVTVQNCDDMATLVAALGLISGFEARFVVVQTKNADSWSHIWSELKEPRSGQWIALDLSVNKHPGWRLPDRLIEREKVWLVK